MFTRDSYGDIDGITKKGKIVFASIIGGIFLFIIAELYENDPIHTLHNSMSVFPSQLLH